MTRRRLLWLALFLLLGAIVNVGVAWGCAFGHQSQYFEWVVSNDLSMKDRSLLEVPASHQRWPGIAQEYSTPGCNMIVMAFEPLDPSGQLLILGDKFAGWPLFALYSSMSQAGWGVPERHFYTIVLQRKGSIPYRMPLSPLWPGFAINTLFYAAILWLLFAVPGHVRRRLRIRHGLCPACAYPAGTSQVCTECGAALPVRALARPRALPTPSPPP